MERSCRQCRKFSPWAVAMVIMDDAKICKDDIWAVEEGMTSQEIEAKLQTAASCVNFEPRANKS